MRRKQDWRLFVFFGCLCGAGLAYAGIRILLSAIQENQTGGALACGIIFIILGIGLAIGATVMVRAFCNVNAGKKDNSIIIQFQMETDGKQQVLLESSVLKNELMNLPEGKEILVTLTPEYFGPVSWKFIKRKNLYVSFVKLHKKDKYREYFIIPEGSIDKALAPFLAVFEQHEAVNTADLIDMKRYEAFSDWF